MIPSMNRLPLTLTLSRGGRGDIAMMTLFIGGRGDIAMMTLFIGGRGDIVIRYHLCPDPLPRGEREYCCPEAGLRGLY